MEYLGYAIVLIGCAGVYPGIKMIYRKPKYEYEKTTNGKDTKFLTFDESEKHRRIINLGKLSLFISILILVIGIYLIVLDYLNP